MLLLAACAAEAPPLGGADETGEVATPDFGAGARVAGWSADEAVAALAAALAGDFPSPFSVRSRLESWFSYGDAACPGEGTMMIGPSLEGCYAESGWYYLGVGGYTEDTIADDVGTALSLSLMADMRLASPDGAAFEAGGHWIHTVHRYDGGASWNGVLNGSWSEAPDLDLSAWLFYEGDARGEATYAKLDGGLGLPAANLRFDAFAVGIEECGGVPRGEAGIQDPSGGWWDFAWDETCSACTISFEGTPVDGTCPDLGGLNLRIAKGMLP